MEEKFICCDSEFSDVTFGETAEEAFINYLSSASYPEAFEHLKFFKAKQVPLKLKLELCGEQ